MSRRAIWILTAFYCATYAVLAVARVGFPFAIDPMEGGHVAVAARFLTGAPMYVAPDLTYVPILYPPLYFVLGGALAQITELGYLPLRLVSILSTLVVVATIAWIVRRDHRPRWAVAAAIGVFLGYHGRSSFVLDTGRVDACALAFILASLALLFWVRARLPIVAVAGVFGGLALLTKQTMFILVITAAAQTFFRGGRRRALLYLATTAATAIGLLLALDLLSNPWFYYYNFRIPSSHHVRLDRLLIEAPAYLLATLPVALGVGLLGAAPGPSLVDRLRRFSADPWAVVLFVYIGMALAAKAKDGGGENVFVPVAALAAIQLGRLAPELFAVRWRWLVVVQLVLLIYPPTLAWPTASDRAAGERVVSAIAAIDGDVLVQAFPLYARQAGKPWHAQYSMMCDVAQFDDGLRNELGRAVAERRFAAIIPRADVEPQDLGRCDIPGLTEYYAPAEAIDVPGHPSLVDVLLARPSLFGMVHGGKLERVYRPRR